MVRPYHCGNYGRAQIRTELEAILAFSEQAKVIFWLNGVTLFAKLDWFNVCATPQQIALGGC
jgi:hypothetical protein